MLVPVPELVAVAAAAVQVQALAPTINTVG
jgi:hypothetical protein